MCVYRGRTLLHKPRNRDNERENSRAQTFNNTVHGIAEIIGTLIDRDKIFQRWLKEQFWRCHGVDFGLECGEQHPEDREEHQQCHDPANDPGRDGSLVDLAFCSHRSALLIIQISCDSPDQERGNDVG